MIRRAPFATGALPRGRQWARMHSTKGSLARTLIHATRDFNRTGAEKGFNNIVLLSNYLYCLGMSVGETVNGEPITEQAATAWAEDTEFDADAVTIKRGRGRPGRSAAPSQVVALRLTPEEIGLLDAHAEMEGKSRSEVIRDALERHTAEPVS